MRMSAAMLESYSDTYMSCPGLKLMFNLSTKFNCTLQEY